MWKQIDKYMQYRWTYRQQKSASDNCPKKTYIIQSMLSDIVTAEQDLALCLNITNCKIKTGRILILWNSIDKQGRHGTIFLFKMQIDGWIPYISY